MVDFVLLADPDDPTAVRIIIHSARGLRYALAIKMPLGHPFATRLAAASAETFVSDLLEAGLTYEVRIPALGRTQSGEY